MRLEEPTVLIYHLIYSAIHLTILSWLCHTFVTGFVEYFDELVYLFVSYFVTDRSCLRFFFCYFFMWAF